VANNVTGGGKVGPGAKFTSRRRWPIPLALTSPFLLVDHGNANPVSIDACFWLAGAKMVRGWVRSVSGNILEGLSWLEQGIEDYRAAGALVGAFSLAGVEGWSFVFGESHIGSP